MKKMKVWQVEEGRAFQVIPETGPQEDVWVKLGSSEQEENEFIGEVLCQHKRSSVGKRRFWAGLDVMRLAPTDVMKHTMHPGFILSEQRMAKLRAVKKAWEEDATRPRRRLSSKIL